LNQIDEEVAKNQAAATKSTTTAAKPAATGTGTKASATKSTTTASKGWTGPSYPKPVSPTLIFSWYAWLKLKFMCYAGSSEVAGYGISRGTDRDDVLYLIDFMTIPQEADGASWEFEQDDIYDFIAHQFDEYGREPCEVSRIQIHTHPGSSASPSGVDEANFVEYFGGMSWGVMMILARGGETYARLRHGDGPDIHTRLDVRIDWDDFPNDSAALNMDYGVHTSDMAELTNAMQTWEDEYKKNVTVRSYGYGAIGFSSSYSGNGSSYSANNVASSTPGSGMHNPYCGVYLPGDQEYDEYFGGEDLGAEFERGTGRHYKKRGKLYVPATDEDTEADDGLDENGKLPMTFEQVKESAAVENMDIEEFLTTYPCVYVTDAAVVTGMVDDIDEIAPKDLEAMTGEANELIVELAKGGKV
jgi:hypothetical protein